MGEQSPADADPEIAWSISDPNLATIEGNVLTVNPELTQNKNATITATSWNGVTSTAVISIYIPDVKSVTLGDVDEYYAIGDVINLPASVKDNISRTYMNQLVTFTTSDETIAAVDQSGQVRCLRTGEVTITAQAENGISDSVTFTVCLPAEDFTMPKLPILFTGQTVQASVAEMDPEGAEIGLIYYSEDENVAVVDADGNVTITGPGETEIFARSWNGLKRSTQVEAHDQITEVKIDPIGQAYEILDEIQLTARVMAEQEFTNRFVTWSSSDTSVANVDENGLVYLCGFGRVTVTAETVNGLMAKIEFTLLEKIENFDLLGPVELLPAESAVMEVVDIVPVGADMALTWETSDENVVTVDEEGKVCAVGFGIATVTAISWNGVSRTCSVMVSQNFERLDTLMLPSGLQTIEREGISNISAEVVRIPASCTTVGARAFADSQNLKYAVFEGNAITIHEEAFDKGIVFICPYGSDAALYAKANGIVVYTY